MPSLTARCLRLFFRGRLKPVPTDDRFVEELRRRTDTGAAPPLLSRRVGLRPIGPGEAGSTPGIWVGVPAARRHILYLHGGYYVGGRLETYRALAGRLAIGLDADVAIVRYRRPPEHPYPAALDDGLAAYRGLLARGIDPTSVAVVGDSAGGGLTLAVLQRAAAEGLPLPGAAVLLSPWTDLTCSGDSVERHDQSDDMLSAAALRRSAACYGAGHDLADPGLSPLFGDLSGLPPILVTVDRSETLLDDALRLVERVGAAGTPCELRETTGLFHIWPVFVPYLPEARRTVGEIVAFLDERLA